MRVVRHTRIVQTILDDVFGPIKQTAGSVTQSTETICGATNYRAAHREFHVTTSPTPG